MRKTILFITLSLFFALNISGCSLFSSSEDEQETATVAEEGAEAAEGEGDEFASDDFEKGDFEDSGEFASDEDLDFDAQAMASEEVGAELADLTGGDVEVEDNFGAAGDEYADDSYGLGGAETAAAETAVEDFIDDNSFGTGETAAADSLYVDEGGLPSDTLSGNQETDLFGASTDPVVDTPVFAEDSFSSGGYAADSGFSDPAPDSPNYVPVKKIKPAAYKRAGANINRLYVVRPGDNMDSIAQKLYNGNRSAEDLYSYNSHFRGKTLNVGDKIYYESPSSPNDQSMKTYYEDINVPAQYYSTQEGDNIRKVAKNLLGHDRSWMEIWATNENVESKWRIPAGVQLRYWPEGSDTQTTLASTEPTVEPEPMPIAEPEPEPMPEPAEVAMNDPQPMDDPSIDEPMMDEPAETDEIAEASPFGDDAGSEDEGINPPPAVGAVEPPPSRPTPPPAPKAIAPPPAPKANSFNKPAPPSNLPMNNGGDPMASMTSDTKIMGALGGLLILAAIIMLIFIRRSRSKRVNFSQTQI